ncbi:MAG: hypothetical protein ACRC2S_02950, partial [Waterburya sp.]
AGVKRQEAGGNQWELVSTTDCRPPNQRFGGGLYPVGQGSADGINIGKSPITQSPASCPLPPASPEGLGHAISGGGELSC